MKYHTCLLYFPGMHTASPLLHMRHCAVHDGKVRCHAIEFTTAFLLYLFSMAWLRTRRARERVRESYDWFCFFQANPAQRRNAGPKEILNYFGKSRKNRSFHPVSVVRKENKANHSINHNPVDASV